MIGSTLRTRGRIPVVWLLGVVATVDMAEFAVVRRPTPSGALITGLSTLAAGVLASAVLSAIRQRPPPIDELPHAIGLGETAGSDLFEPFELGATTDQIRGILAASSRIQVVFQPIQELSNRHVVGHEALARFPDRRPPDIWFAEAHAIGLGVHLEFRALERALSLVPTDATTYVSLNVSPVTLTSPDLSDWLARHSGRHIVLELTEHAAVNDYEALQRAVRRVQALGVLVAVDDLGSGFASLRHVVKLRPDMIKLDRSLVSRIDADVALRDLAAALVQFAASSGCTVIAEGIERPEERATCIEIGVRFGQGYLLGAPGPPEPSSLTP